MAFTFQINNDVKFKHDEKLLAKAEGFRPEIKKERIHPTRIVEVIEDPLKLNGVGVTESDKNIDKIEEYGLKRNDKMILDFGDHRVAPLPTPSGKPGTGSRMADQYFPRDFSGIPACGRSHFRPSPLCSASVSGAYGPVGRRCRGIHSGISEVRGAGWAIRPADSTGQGGHSR